MPLRKTAARAKRAAKRGGVSEPKSAQELAAMERRKEWRFRLPLKAVVEGRLPQGQDFQEPATIENISSTGAYFCLDSGISVGSKLNVIIELPSKLSGGKKMRMLLGGITIRLEEADKRAKKQGVAVRFEKDFKIIPNE